jgi:hypothetical protein
MKHIHISIQKHVHSTYINVAIGSKRHAIHATDFRLIMRYLCFFISMTDSSLTTSHGLTDTIVREYVCVRVPTKSLLAGRHVIKPLRTKRSKQLDKPLRLVFRLLVFQTWLDGVADLENHNVYFKLDKKKIGRKRNTEF